MKPLEDQIAELIESWRARAIANVAVSPTPRHSVKTVRCTRWPPTHCQACTSTDIHYSLVSSHEGDCEYCWCNICKAEQVYWFQNCDEPGM